MTNRVQRICKQCGTKFKILKCQTKRGRGKYCSLKCTNESFKNGSYLICARCGKPFYRSLGNRRAKIFFCSPKCVTAGNVKKKRVNYLRRGDKHIHIAVAEIHLKRKLKPGEVVHHIDENKHNNRPNNLAVLPSASIHHKVHFSNYNFDKYKLENFMPDVSGKL